MALALPKPTRRPGNPHRDHLMGGRKSARAVGEYVASRSPGGHRDLVVRVDYAELRRSRVGDDEFITLPVERRVDQERQI
jgi:hypothetical protein